MATTTNKLRFCKAFPALLGRRSLRFTTAVFLIFLTLPNVASAQAQAVVTGDEFQDWIQSLAEATDSATELKREHEERRSQMAALAAAKGDTPLTLTSSGERNEARPLKATKTTETNSGYDTQNTLTVQTKRGLQATLTGGYTFADVNNVPDPIEPRSVGSKTIGSTMRLFYDLVSGGANGTGMTNERLQISTIQKALRDLDTAELQYRITLHGLLVDYYVGRCKLQAAKLTDELSEKTLSLAHVRYEAKLLSYTDYLNILDAGLSIKQTIAATNATIAGTLGQLSGTAPQLTPEILSSRPITKCAPNLDDALARAKSSELNPQQATRKTPSYLSAASAVDSAKANLQLARLKEKPTLGPFVAANYAGTPDVPPRTVASASIGMSLTWILPSGQTNDTIRSAAIEVVSTERGAQLAQETVSGNFRQLMMTIDAQGPVLAAERASLDNGRKILQISESQMTAGIVDSTTYNRVRVSTITAELALLDTWSVLRKAAFELDLNRRYIDSVGSSRAGSEKLE